MQELKCIYLRVRQNVMLVKTQYIISCPNISLELIPKTPLILIGDFISKTSFNVVDIRLDTSDDSKLIDLLKRRTFQGVGESKAKLILRALKYTSADLKLDNFTEMEYEDIVKSIHHLNLLPETVERLAIFITGIAARTKLYEQIKIYGGTFNDADNLYQKFHTASIDILQNEPYKGVECGFSLQLCDKIAKDKPYLTISSDRFNAIGKIFDEYITSAGNCCIQLSKAVGIIEYIQRTNVFPPVSPLSILDFLSAYHKVIFTEDDRYGTLVYPRHSYHIEQGIARELDRLCESPQQLGFWKYSGEWAPDPDQMRAIRLIQSTGVKIITGGPGTGKTSVIHEIIREYKKHSGIPGVFLCAPTGAAAARINQSVNGEYHAVTIHKLLDVREFGPGDYHYKYNRNRQLPIGLYILDEVSMVSEELFYRFLLAVPTGSTVILSGDVDQLQSISSGTVLQDLIDAQVIETVRLSTIHRQNGQSLIVINCQHIKNGDGYVEAGPGFTVNLLDRSVDRLNATAYYYQMYKGQCQILTCARKGRLGKILLDSLITEAHAIGQTEYKDTGFYLGDKVMMIRNNYSAGYFNGDCGIITAIEDDQISVQFYDGLLTLTDTEITDMEHAWSCTVHKSQGNEYDNVIIVLDPEYPNMLYRSLLFTAVSRARYNVHLITTVNALSKALNNTTEDKRVTGLMGILRKRFLKDE